MTSGAPGLGSPRQSRRIVPSHRCRPYRRLRARFGRDRSLSRSRFRAVAARSRQVGPPRRLRPRPRPATATARRYGPVRSTSITMLIDVSRHHPVEQRVDSSHMVGTEAGIRLDRVSLRYARPAELDAIAMVVGPTRPAPLRSLASPVRRASTHDVSIYRTPGCAVIADVAYVKCRATRLQREKRSWYRPGRAPEADLGRSECGAAVGGESGGASGRV